MTFTDDQLVAFLDGRAGPEIAAAIEARIAADPAFAASIARQRALTAGVRTAYAPILDAPVPARLTDAIAAHQRARLRADGRPRGLIGAGLIGAGLAASFALGFLLKPPAAPQAEMIADAGGLRAGGALARALDGQASGDAVNGVRLVMTAPAEGGGYCRAFVDTRSDQALEGVACAQDQAGWRIVALQANAADAPGSAYRPAAGAPSAGVLAVLDARRSADPLGAEDEQAALRAGLRPR